MTTPQAKLSVQDILNRAFDPANNRINVSNSGGSFSSDVFIEDTYGLVVGAGSQITGTVVSEFQVLGTGLADSSGIFGRWTANSSAPAIEFIKSRNATIGSNTIVNPNDVVGQILFTPDDGVDFATLAARFQAQVDDVSPAAGDIGMAFGWWQMPGGGGALAETMRLRADGSLETMVGHYKSLGSVDSGAVAD